MENERIAIIDVMNLAYRAFHVIPPQIWASTPGALFTSMMKTCQKIQNDLVVDTLAFCFDGGYTYRRNILPGYKQSRANPDADPERAAVKQTFFDQVSLFRQLHLPEVGAVNIFYAQGFEADDLVASCVAGLGSARKIYIVSSDEDLYQLIQGNRVVIYKPQSHTIYSESDFRAAHEDIPPCLYASAKAWAGCSADEIPGIRGVGMKTACKFMSGRNFPKREVFFEHLEVYNRNIELTRLPAPGTPECRVLPQTVPLDWDKVLGMIRQNTMPRGVKR